MDRDIALTYAIHVNSSSRMGIMPSYCQHRPIFDV
jgi:hypothetical protein